MLLELLLSDECGHMGAHHPAGSVFTSHISIRVKEHLDAGSQDVYFLHVSVGFFAF